MDLSSTSSGKKFLPKSARRKVDDAHHPSPQMRDEEGMPVLVAKDGSTEMFGGIWFPRKV